MGIPPRAATSQQGGDFCGARRSTPAALTTGLLLLVLIVPQHIMLWAGFPVWYHLTVLFSLIPLAYVGRRIASGRTFAVTDWPKIRGS